MTETEIWIEDAIKGGWHIDQKFRLAAGYIKFTTTDADGFLDKIPVAEALINPFVWQAVSKTRGWDWAYCYTCKSRVPLWGQCECDEDEQQPEAVMAWHRNWTRFIDHLADGKTIEEALLAIK